MSEDGFDAFMDRWVLGFIKYLAFGTWRFGLWCSRLGLSGRRGFWWSVVKCLVVVAMVLCLVPCLPYLLASLVAGVAALGLAVALVVGVVAVALVGAVFALVFVLAFCLFVLYAGLMGYTFWPWWYMLSGKEPEKPKV